MFLIPLLLGMLAIPLPFISLVLMMLYAGKTLPTSLLTPHRLLAVFCAIPFAMLIMEPSEAGLVASANSILGVGIAVYVFLIAVRMGQSISNSFAYAVIWTVLYGTLRHILWSGILSKQLEEGLALIQNQNLTWIDPSALTTTTHILRLLWPVTWTGTQLIALLIGFLLFHTQIGLRFSWQMIRYPAIFTLLPLAVIPLYLISNIRMLFINLLISLCFLPFLQGIGVVLNKASRLISNKLVRGILLVSLSINAISYALITLLGLADQWWDFRKTNAGGNPE